MDTIISGECQDGQLREQPTQQDLESLDVTGVVDCEGEWQIPTLGGLPTPAKGYHNPDFRNPHTGESIIPTQVYSELQRDVHKASQPYRLNFIFLVVIVYMTVLLIPFLMAIFYDDVNFSTSIYILILVCFVGSLLLGFLIWKTGMQWMNKSLHARMERVVEERRGTLRECGVELGYSCDTTRCYWNRSHLWLRRIPEAQQLLQSTVTTASSSMMESTTRNGEEPLLFPPIFISWMVPGEIHISEKQYDPSMILDKEVWTMIQKLHFGSFKPYHRYLAILMAALVILLFVYTIFISYFMYVFGDLEAWLGCLGLLSGFVLTWYILDRLNVRACSQVADQVTLLLVNSESPNMTGIQLKFETSLLPYRNGPVSRRYQLSRVDGNNGQHSGVVDGKVDHDDDEHHIL